MKRKSRKTAPDILLAPLEAELIRAAVKAVSRAYAPYSRFPVGAALRTADGRIFTGVNVENASYGLTVCAERVALFSAVAAGARQLSAVAVVAGGSAPATPCGACLQVLAEFMPPQSVILLATRHGTKIRRLSLMQLLPHAFSLNRRKKSLS